MVTMTWNTFSQMPISLIKTKPICLLTRWWSVIFMVWTSLTVAPTATLICAENVFTVLMPSRDLYASHALVLIIKIFITWEEIMTCKSGRYRTRGTKDWRRTVIPAGNGGNRGRPKTSENVAAMLVSIATMFINKISKDHNVGLQETIEAILIIGMIGMVEDRPDEQEAQETIVMIPSLVKILSRCWMTLETGMRVNVRLMENS